jgi:hypothetical protein
MEKMKVNQIVFRGEQDGPVERELKTMWAACFAEEKQVTEAYLARVSYGSSSEQKVALCLKGGDENAQKIVQCLGAAFHRIFKPTESLDILFLTEAQMQEISSVARPFYCFSA